MRAKSNKLVVISATSTSIASVLLLQFKVYRKEKLEVAKASSF